MWGGGCKSRAGPRQAPRGAAWRDAAFACQSAKKYGLVPVQPKGIDQDGSVLLAEEIKGGVDLLLHIFFLHQLLWPCSTIRHNV